MIILLNLNDWQTGNVYRFKTNTNSFTIHLEISSTNKVYYPNMGKSAREGIMVLYKHPIKDVWTNVKAFGNVKTALVNLSQSVGNNIFYEVIIYAPLFATVENIEVECEDNYEILPADMSDDKSILVMGGQKSFGVGCTTCGTMFSNIIGRKHNANVKNISFHEGDYLEKLFDYLKKNKIGCSYYLGILELDYFNDKSSEYLKDIITNMNMHCEHLIGWYAISDSQNYRKKNIKKVLSDESDRIIVKDLSFIFNEESDMCTYDDEHINDAGNILIYSELICDIMEVI